MKKFKYIFPYFILVYFLFSNNSNAQELQFEMLPTTILPESEQILNVGKNADDELFLAIVNTDDFAHNKFFLKTVKEEILYQSPKNTIYRRAKFSPNSGYILLKTAFADYNGQAMENIVLINTQGKVICENNFPWYDHSHPNHIFLSDQNFVIINGLDLLFFQNDGVLIETINIEKYLNNIVYTYQSNLRAIFTKNGFYVAFNCIDPKEKIIYNNKKRFLKKVLLLDYNFKNKTINIDNFNDDTFTGPLTFSQKENAIYLLKGDVKKSSGKIVKYDNNEKVEIHDYYKIHTTYTYDKYLVLLGRDQFKVLDTNSNKFIIDKNIGGWIPRIGYKNNNLYTINCIPEKTKRFAGERKEPYKIFDLRLLIDNLITKKEIVIPIKPSLDRLPPDIFMFEDNLFIENSMIYLPFYNHLFIIKLNLGK